MLTSLSSAGSGNRIVSLREQSRLDRPIFIRLGLLFIAAGLFLLVDLAGAMTAGNPLLASVAAKFVSHSKSSFTHAEDRNPQTAVST